MERDPYLDAGTKGWIVKTAKKNYWRVAAWYDLGDLIQDGYLCYYKCRARYTKFSVLRHPSKDDKRQFMALVQAAYTNHINTLATRRTANLESLVSQVAVDGESPDAYFERVHPGDLNEGALMSLLARAPDDVAAFLRLALVDANEAVARSRLVRQPNGRLRTGKRALRETTNEHYSRRLGLPPGTDICGRVKSYFRGDDGFDRLVELIPSCMYGK